MVKKKLIVYLDNTKFPNLTNVSFEAKAKDSLCWEVKGNGTLVIRIERHTDAGWKRETIAVYPTGSWSGWLATKLEDWGYEVKY